MSSQTGDDWSAFTGLDQSVVWYMNTVPVSAPSRHVIRDFRTRFQRFAPEASRQYRKDFYRAVLAIHRQNQELFRFVVRGY